MSFIIDRIAYNINKLFKGNTTIPDEREEKRKANASTQSGFVPPNQQINLSYTRLDRYRDYEDMDASSPYASTALDIYAADAFQMDRFIGSSLWITGEDKKNVKELNRLVQEVMGIEDTGEMDLRDVAKYGSTKSQNIFNRGTGILRIIPINDDINIQRIENEMGILQGFRIATDISYNPFGGQDIDGQETIDYKPYEIGHIRLKARPYSKTVASRDAQSLYDLPREGASMMEAARRSIKNYEMLKEAIIVYRLTHSMDRFLYKIDMTDKAPDEAMAFAKTWTDAIKKRVFVDKATGKLQLMANIPSLMEDITLPHWKDNETSIEILKGVGDVSNIADLLLLQTEIESGLKFPPGSLFSTDGAMVSFDKNFSSKFEPLSRYITKLQRAYIAYIIKICQFHLILRGENHDPKKFRVNMSPVSDSIEIQKSEVLGNLISNASNLLSLGDQIGLNKDIWSKYVMKLTLGRLDFGEIAEMLGYKNLTDTAKLMTQSKEAVMEHAKELEGLSTDSYEALTLLTEAMSDKQYKGFALEAAKLVNYYTSNAKLFEEHRYMSLFNVEMNDYTAMLKREEQQLLSDNVDHERRSMDAFESRMAKLEAARQAMPEDYTVNTSPTQKGRIFG